MVTNCCLKASLLRSRAAASGCPLHALAAPCTIDFPSHFSITPSFLTLPSTMGTIWRQPHRPCLWG